jgi:hypothetical protein
VNLTPADLAEQLGEYQLFIARPDGVPKVSQIEETFDWKHRKIA